MPFTASQPEALQLKGTSLLTPFPCVPPAAGSKFCSPPPPLYVWFIGIMIKISSNESSAAHRHLSSQYSQLPTRQPLHLLFSLAYFAAAELAAKTSLVSPAKPCAPRSRELNSSASTLNLTAAYSHLILLPQSGIEVDAFTPEPYWKCI